MIPPPLDLLEALKWAAWANRDVLVPLAVLVMFTLGYLLGRAQ